MSNYIKPDTGLVKFVNTNQGYGFIVKDSDGTDIYFNLKSCIDRVHIGDRVSFEIGENLKGKCATQVKMIDK